MTIIDTVISMPDEEFPEFERLMIEGLVENLTDVNYLRQVAAENRESLVDAVSSKEMLERGAEALEGIREELPPAKFDFLTKFFGLLISAQENMISILEEGTIVRIKRDEGVRLPEYANFGDSGMDVFALDDYDVLPGETVLVPTGLYVAVPQGYELQVRPKSGRALKTKLRVANTPGTIDSTYRSEIGVIIENIESPIKDIEYEFNDDGSIKILSIEHGKPYIIEKGTKFAQLVLVKVETANLVEVTDLDETSRDGGFGSTGLV